MALRHEIQEALNVIEHWNNVNDFIRFGKGGDFATNQLEEREISMLAQHLVWSKYSNALRDHGLL